MVVSALDNQEMKVDLAVTLTKIRWSHRKEGTENMTSAEEKNDHEFLTEEDESLFETIESEMRDVLTKQWL